MAATFAQNGNRTATSAVTTHTMSSQSVSAVTNGIGFLGIITVAGSTADRVTGATWGGSPMTRVDSISFTLPSNYRIYLYAIVAPPTGTVTIECTTSVSENCVLWWSTVQDAAQTAPEASITGTVTNSTSASLAITTLTNNALVLAVAYSGTNSAVPTAIAGTTLQQNFFNLQFTWTSPQVTAGSNTSGIQSMTAGADTAIVACSIAEFGGGGGATPKLLSLMGVGS